MKESIFNYKVNLDDDKTIIYNTFSRKYLVSSKNNELYDIVMEKMNGNEYSLEEFELLKEMISKGILVKNDVDELERVKLLERSALFQNKSYNLTIQPTLDCNFRCVYCYEDHKKLYINNDTESKILKLVQNKTTNIKHLNVVWFGGEPMLSFDAMKKMSVKIKEICEKNNCTYTETIVSNGYLFSDKVIRELKEMSVQRLQITLDGDKDCHNKQRPLLNGLGTYDKVTENMRKLAENDFKITFRINVSEENYNNILSVLDIIPKNKRNNVAISICNLFQTENKLNAFNLYKAAIEYGYQYYDTKNSFCNCENVVQNSLTVEPDGKCSICSCIGETGLKIGYLNNDGDLVYTNEGKSLKIKNLLTTSRDMCNECKRLPMCMGGCAYSRYKNENFCSHGGASGLSLDEVIRLHYYYDLTNTM